MTEIGRRRFKPLFPFHCSVHGQWLCGVKLEGHVKQKTFRRFPLHVVMKRDARSPAAADGFQRQSFESWSLLLGLFFCEKTESANSDGMPTAIVLDEAK